MEFKVFELGPIGTNAILAFDRSLGKALLFDAPGDSFEVVKAFTQTNGLELEALLLTHGHWDHMLDASLFKNAGVPVLAHKDDQYLLEHPEAMATFAFPGMAFNAVKVDTWLTPGFTLSFLEKKWEVRHVPGHCPGSLLFYNAESDTAIVGDAIFAGGVGRSDLPGGDFASLEWSIKTQIYTLPEETTLYPGHGPDTTVGRERVGNPFVRM